MASSLSPRKKSAWQTLTAIRNTPPAGTAPASVSFEGQDRLCRAALDFVSQRPEHI